MNSRERGQVLPMVMLSLVILSIIIAGLVRLIQNDTTWAVKEQKSTSAINMAEAAIDRAVWKLQSTTSTFADASAGVTISNYNFDKTFTDIPGGTYRIDFSSGPLALEVTIVGEGRDAAARETRAVQAIYKNVAVAGAIVTGGTLADSGQAITHWGAEMAMNNITLSGSALTQHYPRKLSNQVVLPYDANGITPPNTDNLEWWSSYPIPALPILDFLALKASATATGTYDCRGDGASMTCNNASCNAATMNCTVTNFYQNPKFNGNYVWYWDHNVSISEPGTKGTIIVRGDLTTTNADWYGPFGPLGTNVTLAVPTNAWMEYQKMDTAAIDEYPGDLGLHKNAATYVIGSCSAACEGSPSGSDLGFYGFVYVGGNVNFSGDADIYGAVWVVGSWTASGNNIVFYNDNLVLPTLNVTLIRQSWQEVAASPVAWP